MSIGDRPELPALIASRVPQLPFETIVGADASRVILFGQRSEHVTFAGPELGGMSRAMKAAGVRTFATPAPTDIVHRAGAVAMEGEARRILDALALPAPHDAESWTDEPSAQAAAIDSMRRSGLRIVELSQSTPDAHQPYRAWADEMRAALDGGGPLVALLPQGAVDRSRDPRGDRASLTDRLEASGIEVTVVTFVGGRSARPLSVTAVAAGMGLASETFALDVRSQAWLPYTDYVVHLPQFDIRATLDRGLGFDM